MLMVSIHFWMISLHVNSDLVVLLKHPILPPVREDSSRNDVWLHLPSAATAFLSSTYMKHFLVFPQV